MHTLYYADNYQDHSPDTSPEASLQSSPDTPGPRGKSTSKSCSRRGRRSRGRGGRASSHGSEHSVVEQEWGSELSGVVVEAFERDSGPTTPISANPTDVFLAFFTPQLIQHICTETNKYAATCISTTQSSSGSEMEWATTEEEIQAYLGFLILMGITKLPDLYDYWSQNEMLHNFAIASRIPHKRFLELQRYRHFIDDANIVPRGQLGYDRLAKVRPVLDSLRATFLGNYTPHRDVAIDEAMVPFKGRSCLKQYVPLKPLRKGSRFGLGPTALMAMSVTSLSILGRRKQWREILEGKLSKS